MKTVALYTLGCKVSQYETEAIAEGFESRAFRVVPFGEKADVFCGEMGFLPVLGIGEAGAGNFSLVPSASHIVQI